MRDIPPEDHGVPDALPALEMRLLGPPAVLVDGRAPPPDIVWHKHLALLAYLALSPQRVRARSHLQALLWPEKDADRARHSLNEALRRLRAGLGRARIVSRGDAVVLDGVDLSVDVLAPDPAPGDGEFMEGFSLDDAPAFDDWISAERRDLREGRVRAAIAAAEEHLAAGRWDDARQDAQHAVRLDPLSEPAVRVAMRVAAITGDRTRALALYTDFSQRCHAELNAEPPRSLHTLMRTIRDGTWQRARPRGRPPPPLVGRSRVHSRAFALMREATRGRPAVLAVLGQAGSGKTRLLEEVVERSLLDGARTAIARPIAPDRDRAWTMLRQLFRHGLADAPGLPGASPRALGVLATVVPELRDRSAPEAPGGIADVGDALGDILHAVTDESPLLLALDDVDHADASSVAAIESALAHPDHAQLGVVLAETPGVGGGTAAAELVTRLGRTLSSAVVTLDPLTLDDAHTLVSRVARWCPSEDQRDRLARRLHAETDGNPLLMTVLLEGLDDVVSLRDDAAAWPPPAETLNAPVPAEVHHLAQLVTRARLQQLDAPTRDFFVAATFGGRVVDPAITGAVVALDAPAVERAVTELERRGLLTFDGEHYRLPAPLLAAAAAAGFLTRGQQRRIVERYREVVSAEGRTMS